MEYKFRGKRVDNKEWVYGWVLEERGNTYILENRQKESQLNKNIAFRVNPETVGQYTGIKDKNGKEIYENDICNISQKIDMKIIVDYKDAGFGWSDKYNNLAFRGHGYLRQILEDIEVIGNRFENPELLEEQCEK